MNHLPRLFAKNQIDPNRISTLLLLPQQMNLSLYLDMRLVTNYESLWKDIRKQFMKQHDPFILERTMETVRYFLHEENLSAPNTEQKTMLEREVIDALKATAGEVDIPNAVLLPKDVVESMSGNMLRISLLAKSWDVSAALEESDPDTPNSVVTIAKDILERGFLGLDDEESVS
jgi:cohesin complex subunit SA-1/2